MAQFEPNKNSQDSFRPRPSRAEDPLEWGLDGAEQFTDKITGFSLSRYKPKWFRKPKFVQRRIDALPPEMRHRLSVISGWAQTGFIIVAITFSIALIFKTLLNQTIIEPNNAKDVFVMVDDPSEPSYTLETVRKKDIDGGVSTHHTLSIIGSIPSKGIVQAQVSGVAVSPYRMVSDGKTWLMKFQDDGRVNTLPGVPTKDMLTPVYASDLKADGISGELIDNKATVSGRRGWLLTWKPTPQLLLRLINQKLLMLDNGDIQAMKAGKVKVDFASATVIRSSRTLYQLDTRFRTNGAIIRVLVTYQPQSSGNLNLR